MDALAIITLALCVAILGAGAVFVLPLAAQMLLRPMRPASPANDNPPMRSAR
jgi:hypothetical protein